MDQYKWGLLKKKARYLGYDILTRTGTNKLLAEWVKVKGFNNYEEYLDIMAIGRGFTCYDEYTKVWEYYPGMPNPISENRKDPRFIGLYIAENSILKLFEGSQKMKCGNHGYDIVCNKGYKIEVKAATLTRQNTLSFHIARNKIADYFILIGFNNIIELRPLYLWIIKNDEIIRGCRLRDIDVLGISNEPEFVKPFKKYDTMDKLEKLKEICKGFNDYEKIEVYNDNIPTKAHILDIIVKTRLSGKPNVTPKDVSDILKEEQKIENRLPILPIDECSR